MDIKYENSDVIKGDFGEDKLIVENNDVTSNFSLTISKEIRNLYLSFDGILGLAKSYSDNSYSFSFKLKEKEIIENNAFSIQLLKSLYYQEEAKINFGKKHEFLSPETITCDTGNSNRYEFEGKKIGLKFGTKNVGKNLDFKIIFIPGKEYIYIPKEILVTLPKSQIKECSVDTSIGFKI